jgi:SSS family solute:Na+ symporter
MSLFGTGQQAVQRFLSCRDLESARAAALTGWTAGTIALGVTLFLGVCIGAWAALAPEAPSMKGLKADEVLPHFIDTRLPAGVAGLMLAAIFAASMSSLDSAIHSMSTAAIVDFYRRFSKRAIDARRELRFARVATVLFGVVATYGAIVAARTETTLLETLVTWLGYFAGPLLGLFGLGMLTKRANEFGALVGTFVAIAFVLGLAWAWTGPQSGAPYKPWGFHRLWFAPFSCFLTFGLGLLASLARVRIRA